MSSHKDDANGQLQQGHDELAAAIADSLSEILAGDSVLQCGASTLHIIRDRPHDVLKLAHHYLHAWPYSTVPTCWRRLYEEASLWKVVALLRDSSQSHPHGRVPRDAGQNGTLGDPPNVCPIVFNEFGQPSESGQDLDDVATRDSTRLDSIVECLDMGLALSGAPGRKSLFDAIFDQLAAFQDRSQLNPGGYGQSFHIVNPEPLYTRYPLSRADDKLDFESFQHHITKSSQPIVMTGTVDQWPAFERWRNPSYLMNASLGGRRLVPVEVGSAYTDADWGQKMMSFRRYLTEYLGRQEPGEIGYLAQHDLLAQLPALRKDIAIPDFCYSSPPPVRRPPRNASEAKAAELDQLDEPLINAWLGPKGTKSPLHTDPYHNILCQVVGYKYVRMYSPNETEKLYPRDVDEAGVDMSNTSSVDVAAVRAEDGGGSQDVDRSFPAFKQARYQETILRPGECLYIPLGWWHYVESLSTSFSVSFWWN